MRAPFRILGALLALIALATQALAGSSYFIQPYNLHYIMGPGDSHTNQAGGFGGTYNTGGLNDLTAASSATSYDAYLGTLLDHRIREGARTVVPGIGGQSAAQALAYPRPIVTLGGFWTGRIDNGTAGNAGQILTITGIAGGATLAMGQLITGPGVAPNTIIDGTGATAGPPGAYDVHPADTCGGSACTGTTGNGTYHVSVSQNVPSTAFIVPAYLYGSGMTIADTAANEAAIVLLHTGTNGSGNAAELAAVDAAVKGLTDPTYSFPGYGGPLPLYGGQAKTIVLANESRYGPNTAGLLKGFRTPALATQMKDYSFKLLRYSYDSGDANYSNPRVIGVNTFDQVGVANLADITNYNLLPGYAADGLHWTVTQLVQIDKAMAARIAQVIPKTYDYSTLPDTTNSARWVTQNPLFTTTTGGTSSCGSQTIIGNIPGIWNLVCGGSGLTLQFTTNPLGGTLGNELVLHITGTPSAGTNVTLTSTASAGQRNTISLATDTIRLGCRSKLQIASGNIVNSNVALTLQADTGTHIYQTNTPANGQTAGFGNQADQPMLFKNFYASAENSNYWTLVTKNTSLAGYATGIPGYIKAVTNLQINTGAYVDVTLSLAQCGAMLVTD